MMSNVGATDQLAPVTYSQNIRDSSIELELKNLIRDACGSEEFPDYFKQLDTNGKINVTQEISNKLNTCFTNVINTICFLRVPQVLAE